MKASELIEKLQNAIEVNGDLDIAPCFKHDCLEYQIHPSSVEIDEEEGWLEIYFEE